MISTLSERLAEAMKGPPSVSGAALARACNCTAASVSDWLSGKTKTMEASNLLAAARLLQVDPDWLASGVGLKRRQTVLPESYRQKRIEHAAMVMERMTDYQLDQTIKIIDTLAEPTPAPSSPRNGTKN